MKCPRCKTDNPDGARFCQHCGSPLGPVCARCATPLPADARFCHSCGAPTGLLAPAAIDARRPSLADEALHRLAAKEYAERLLEAGGQMASERRLVTILFSDVKGSTAMAEGLDPEDVMEIMDGAFDVLIAPVMRYEGTLARLMGDAILAFFGAPVAHEDDAERACRAALEIVEGAKGYAERLEQERGITGFNVRVGINTGVVVVGEVGSDLRVEYTAMGDAINLAARMESAAEPGTVLIAEATHKLIAPLFDTQALEPVQVKGRTEPVLAYRVLAPKAVPGKVRGIEELESPLVGRAAEMAALEEALQRLQAGAGGIIAIVGEAGIGKSRLVAELRSTWTTLRSSAGWIEGRCLSYGSSMAYHLWLDVLGNALGGTMGLTAAAVGERLQRWLHDLCPGRVDEVYPYLARLLSVPLPEQHERMLSGVHGQELRSRTFAAIESAIGGMAGQRPLLLVLEDLHWADATSVALLEHLLPLVEQVPLLIIALFRPYREHASWRLRATAAERPSGRHVDLLLDPLPAADSESLATNLLRGRELPCDLMRRILDRAEGNPFYVEEIIRALLDAGVMVLDEATSEWRVTQEASEIAIPDTLQGVLVARIDRLREDTRRVLQRASVIGRVFLHRILAAIAEGERQLDGHLRMLQQEDMIREWSRGPELEYIFKHDLTREAAYNGLLKKQRRRLHKQVAEALERLFPERVEEHVGLLAHHWEMAGDAQKAIGYLLRAAQRDVQQFANEEAIAHFTRGLALLESLPPGPERIQLEFALQMGLGTPMVAVKGYGAPEVGRAWGRALELSQQMGDPPQLWPARSAISQYYILRAEYQTALQIGRQMAEEDERAGGALAFPFARGPLGITQFYLGQLEQARLHLEAMVARYDREKHHTSAFVYGQDVGVLYLSYLAWVLWFLGYVDQARQRSREAIDLAESLQHPFTLGLALNLAGRLRSSCRDDVATAALAKAAADVARERGFVFFQAAALGLQGWTHVAQGEIEQGEAQIRRSLAMWQATGTLSHTPHFLAWLAEACAKTGRIDQGLALLSEALDLVEKTSERYYEAEVKRHRGELLWMRGDPAAAEAQYSDAIAVAQRQSARSLELRATTSLSRLLQQQGKREEARQMLSAIYGWFTEGFDTPDLKEAKALLEELS